MVLFLPSKEAVLQGDEATRLNKGLSPGAVELALSSWEWVAFIEDLLAAALPRAA